MNYTCEVLHQMAQPTLSIRLKTSVDKLPIIIGQSYGEIMQYIDSIGESLAGIPYVAYYNLDMQDLDVEIGMPVKADLPGQGHIQSGEIPEGDYGTCTHVGPYSEMGPAYEALTKYIEANGHRPSGVCYEYYFNGPEEVPESELITKIAFLLK